MSITPKTTSKKPRKWNKITPEVIAEHLALEVELGNGSAAVREATEDTLLQPGNRAFRIRKISKEENAIEYVDKAIQQIGIDAVNRVGNMVNSVDERIATKNAHFVIDHLRGKAVQRTDNRNVNINIESVLG